MNKKEAHDYLMEIAEVLAFHDRFSRNRILDAIYMSRGHYEKLINAVMELGMAQYLSLVKHEAEDDMAETIFGLRIFVDDSLPDWYLEIGDSFTFSLRKPRKGCMQMNLKNWKLAGMRARVAVFDEVAGFTCSAKNKDLSEETKRSEGVGLYEAQVDRKNEESEGTEKV